MSQGPLNIETLFLRVRIVTYSAPMHIRDPRHFSIHPALDQSKDLYMYIYYRTFLYYIVHILLYVPWIATKHICCVWYPWQLRPKHEIEEPNRTSFGIKVYAAGPGNLFPYTIGIVSWGLLVFFFVQLKGNIWHVSREEVFTNREPFQPR